MSVLHTISKTSVHELEHTDKEDAIQAIENGQVVYFPRYAFTLTETEQQLLDTTMLTPKRKNVSYNFDKNLLTGYQKAYSLKPLLQQMMHRYALFTQQLIQSLLPTYSQDLIWGRTSYRPAQISGRVSSKRKDDTRLHVDAFPSTPVYGQRIFRIFCNIHPQDEPRVWHLGEPFPQVMQAFSCKLPKYSPIRAKLLHIMGATKTKRSAYDHYMLHLHDGMKLDDTYQQNIHKHRIDFPPQSTWLVFTDQVSHAALSGQFLLEQTFYLPVEAMQTPELSPFQQWQRLLSFE